MTSRVAFSLVIHELTERLRDRWVIVATGLFATLSVGVTLYGRSMGESAGAVTAPSLVTLAAFLVPLVALVLGHDAIVGERERHTLGLLMSLPVRRWEIIVAKYLGRLGALTVAVVLGIGASALLLEPAQRAAVWHLIPTTLLMGASFLSLGVLISIVAWRHTTAASLAVTAWFLMVLFWDLGVLGVLVVSDGALSQEAVLAMVLANPAGLYRTGLLVDLVGLQALHDMGLMVDLPSQGVQGVIWALWIGLPMALGTLLLSRPKAVHA